MNAAENDLSKLSSSENVAYSRPMWKLMEEILLGVILIVFLFLYSYLMFARTIKARE